jgi:hypothetical protein
MNPQPTLLMSALEVGCFTLKQFVDKFVAPAMLAVASEQVWPATAVVPEY